MFNSNKNTIPDLLKGPQLKCELARLCSKQKCFAEQLCIRSCLPGKDTSMNVIMYYMVTD